MTDPIRQRHLQRATFGILLAFLAQSLAFQQPLQQKIAARSTTSTTQTQHQFHPHRFAPKCLFQCSSLQFPFGPASSQNQITVLALAARSGISPVDHEDDEKIYNKNNTSSTNVGRRRLWRFRKFVVGLVAFGLGAFAPLKYNVKSASASAPIMAIPKAEARDPGTEAMMEMQRRQALEAQKDLNEMSREARRIEAEQGEAARIKYEQEYKATKKREGEAKAQGLIALKKDLLAQGICPFVDMEGQRQVISYRTGVDLGETPGTAFYMEKLLDKKKSPRAYAVQKEQHRKVVACMVQDMKNRDIDPLDYFEKHQDQTQTILDLPRDRAVQLVERYTANLELYGQITVPKPGEMSAKEKMEASRDPIAEGKRLKEEKLAEAKRLKDEKISEAKRLKEEKQAKATALKAAQNAERVKKKEEARLEKENKKKGSKAAIGSVASATVALGTSAMRDSASKVAGSLESAMNTLSDAPTHTHALSTLGVDDASSSFDIGRPSVSSKENAPTKKKKTFISSKKIISPKAIGGIVIIGGGAVAFKVSRDKAAADELERQRQFKLLMGESEFATKPIDASDDDLDDDEEDSGSEMSTFNEAPAPAPAKKRKLGISLFNKKSNRESDINNLVGQFSPNADFASTLAKLLAFGAPGRFQSVAALPGRIPMEEYNLEAATETLMDIKGDLSQSDTVELFASVVNCMLIDILDLASSALSMKKGKEAATVDALNIVVDFMNHAAGLFGAVAGDDVVIDPPVRYEGTLSKSKLEQMYGIYASAGTDMMSMLMPTEGKEKTPSNVREDHDQRVAMLQDVFGISDKMAEGIITKATQKAMTEMMKPEKMAEMVEKMGGPEGVEKMMQEMGGVEGMEKMMKEMGVDGMDPAMMEAMSNPENLLPEIKRIRAMVEAGTFPKSELKDIQKQFRAQFGSDDIEAALLEGRGTEDLTDTEKEFLEAMSVIMKA